MFLSVFDPHGAVESAVVETPEVEVIGDDVEHLRHLAKDQHFVSFLLESNQHLVENHHLAADVDDLRRRILHFASRMIDQEWMVANAT